jgi:Ca2+-transporting ATPase
MAFMNTQVTRGAATIVVTSTGMGTEVGHISHLLSQTTSEQTPLTKQLSMLTNQILVIAGISLAISIGLGLYRNQAFQTLFLTAVAFSVSAIPTGLPAVVTTIPANGTATLAKAGAIVKRLRSVETLGSTSAINSDKTGTLTLNQMTAVRDGVARPALHDHRRGLLDVGQIRAGRRRGARSDRYMLPMALCSDAVAKDGRSSATRPRARSSCSPPRAASTRRSPASVPAPRRGPVRRRVQAHGHLPRDDRRRRQGRRPVLRQGRPGPAPARAAMHATTDGATVADRDRRPRPYLTENIGSGRRGLRVHGDRPTRLRPATVDRTAADLLPLVCPDLHAAGPRRPRRPAAAQARDAIRDRPCRGHPGPDDHRRTNAVTGRGDRPPARLTGPRDHRRRVRRHGRRHAARESDGHRRDRPAWRRRTSPPRGHPQVEGPHRRHDR